ncbi:unnamed protein product [Zymoseptoria tritici ST99CH_3D7]|uniref:Uncharacterized protein n=1 Tax=Zymoseptoria tritici (strain ST99CH_3D7) TaxID=1276538 RepID=A0A1X7RH00_ZYMT9|nr:unnamed protein product [Zymoseptoria tritici ST99CH_3D7]
MRIDLKLCSEKEERQRERASQSSDFQTAMHGPYEHTGRSAGGATAFDGFVLPQPLLVPEIVSSIAALYAAPQFGSLAPPLAFSK